MALLWVLIIIWACSVGCTLIPRPAARPSLHNPFPQIHKVAVAPFFNLSTEPTLDGRKVAIAYYTELQQIPGFEVIPVGVVERAMAVYRIGLKDAQDARQLAQLLGADAIVVGAVTEYSPYYPPRCGLQVEWYAANPGFHPVPPGYGLPWGSAEERFIPKKLILESQLAYARAALETSSPHCPGDKLVAGYAGTTAEIPGGQRGGNESTQETVSTDDPAGLVKPEALIPQGPDQATPCIPTDRPILVHTRVFDGADKDFVRLLREYSRFRDDTELGGWQPYLAKSDEFLRFCCRVHIWEMLSARGGAGEIEVTWSPPVVR